MDSCVSIRGYTPRQGSVLCAVGAHLSWPGPGSWPNLHPTGHTVCQQHQAQAAVCWHLLPREDPEHSLEILLTGYTGLPWKRQREGRVPRAIPPQMACPEGRGGTGLEPGCSSFIPHEGPLSPVVGAGVSHGSHKPLTKIEQAGPTGNGSPVEEPRDAAH